MLYTAKKGLKVKYTPEALQTAIDAYFAECEDAGVCPDYAGMRVYLELSKDTISGYCDPDIHPRKHREYREIFARARDRRESWFIRQMSSEPRTTSGCIAALKQTDNGGWMDKAGQSASVTVRVQGYDARLAGK